MDLDGKKLTTSNLTFQMFEGFIGTQNKKNFSNHVMAVLENPLFVLWLTFEHFLKFFN
jgi:hypothetical protein